MTVAGHACHRQYNPMVDGDGEKGETPPMQRLMPDSGSPGAERPVQPLFRKSWLFSGLTLAAAIVAAHGLFHVPASRQPRAPATVDVDYRADPTVHGLVGKFRIAGSWTVHVDDPRFGGVSGLALDGASLVAVTDSGVIVRLPRPGKGGAAELRDLPDGPGSPRFKRNRDSEAITADPAGRGWWVAFENRHSLWLYDSGFRRALRRVDLGGLGLRANRGIEGLAASGNRLTLFREWGGLLPLGTGVSDAAPDPGGTIWLTTRSFGLNGVVNRLGRFSGGRVVDAAVLPLGPLDNVEGIAAEPNGSGGTRLWLMTDNDFQANRLTRLIALETR